MRWQSCLILLTLSGAVRADLLPELVAASAQRSAIQVGEGSKYTLQVAGIEGNLAIYVTQVKGATLGIETFFDSRGLGADSYQAYLIQGQKVQRALTLGPGQSTPSPMSTDNFSGQGFQVGDFQIKDLKTLTEWYIRSEKIKVAGALVDCKVYQTSKNGQTITFWLSEQVRPLGLVKLISVSESPLKNYQLEFKSLLKGVAAKIPL